MPELSFNIEKIKQQSLQNNLQKIEEVHVDSFSKTELIKLDVSLIESFWGNNIDRIQSTMTALQKLVKLKKLYDFEWIFVEAQLDESKAVFKWLQFYGIKYIFKKIQKKTQYLWLKMPLWNIGANHSKNKKLLFIDSDVYFLDDNWIQNASLCLQDKDVISLSKAVKYSNSGTMFESIGFQIASKAERKDDYGHSGFTLGLTKKAFKMLGGFDAVNYLDDQWLWMKITGKTNMTSKQFLLPYEPDNSYENGYPFEVGYVDTICVHNNHGNENSDRYKVLNYASYFHFKPFDDIKYNKCKPEKLPEWRKNFAGSLMCKLFKKLEECNDIHKSDYNEILLSICKKINTSNPLIIATMYWPDYVHKNIECVYKLKSSLDAYCKNNFTFICFSNQKIDGIDIIPYKKLATKQETINSALMNPDIEYPQNASIAYIDISERITAEFEFYRCPDDAAFNINAICRLYDNFKSLRYFKQNSCIQEKISKVKSKKKIEVGNH